MQHLIFQDLKSKKEAISRALFVLFRSESNAELKAELNITQFLERIIKFVNQTITAFLCWSLSENVFKILRVIFESIKKMLEPNISIIVFRNYKPNFDLLKWIIISLATYYYKNNHLRTNLFKWNII